MIRCIEEEAALCASHRDFWPSSRYWWRWGCRLRIPLRAAAAVVGVVGEAVAVVGAAEVAAEVGSAVGEAAAGDFQGAGVSNDPRAAEEDRAVTAEDRALAADPVLEEEDRVLIAPASLVPREVLEDSCRRRAPATFSGLARVLSSRRVAPRNCLRRIGLPPAVAPDRPSCPRAGRVAQVQAQRAVPPSNHPGPASLIWAISWGLALGAAQARLSYRLVQARATGQDSGGPALANFRPVAPAPGPPTARAPGRDPASARDPAPDNFRPAARVPGSQAVRAPGREPASQTGPRNSHHSGPIGATGARVATPGGIRR